MPKRLFLGDVRSSHFIRYRRGSTIKVLCDTEFFGTVTFDCPIIIEGKAIFHKPYKVEPGVPEPVIRDGVEHLWETTTA